MPVNKYHFALLLAAACSSCIEPFEPEIGERQSVLVINGTITDIPGPHEVTVSMSTPYNEPYFQPVDGCVVTVEDESGTYHSYYQSSPGRYHAYLPAPFLSVGKAYSLTVRTPQNLVYRSDFDTLLACPPIDTLYYDVQNRGTNLQGRTMNGIQFYSDLTGSAGTATNFRWLLEETWEYRTPYIGQYLYEYQGGPITYFYTDHVHRCFMTHPVSGLHTASTRFLAGNAIRRNPLNYVSDETPRLLYKYSVLVTQQSLTDAAYSYWDQLETQSEESGGLYETQPYSIAGNLCNPENPDEKVLGFFYATQQQTSRLTVPNDFNFDIPGFACTLDTASNYDDFLSDFPYYLITLNPLGGFPFLFGNQDCFDCTERGGVTEIPEFW
jgi:hypothetical protein